jgi:hypothetical protein
VLTYNNCTYPYSIRSRATPAIIGDQKEEKEAAGAKTGRHTIKKIIAKRLEWVG